MNKKANIFITLSVSLFLFVTSVLIMPFLVDDIATARTTLQCSSSAISDGTKLICLTLNGVMPYFIIFFTCLAVGYLLGRNK